MYFNSIWKDWYPNAVTYLGHPVCNLCLNYVFQVMYFMQDQTHATMLYMSLSMAIFFFVMIQ